MHSIMSDVTPSDATEVHLDCDFQRREENAGERKIILVIFLAKLIDPLS